MNNTLIQTFVTSDFVGQVITLSILALSILAWFVIIDKIRKTENNQLFLDSMNQ